MVEAGFNGVFLGIETPNPKALAITKKPQNISTREPDQLKPLPHVHPSLRMHEVYPALMMVRGRLSPGQIPAYSRFIAKVSKDHPSMLAEAIRLAALGYHFREVHPLQRSCRRARSSGSSVACGPAASSAMVTAEIAASSGSSAGSRRS